MSAPDTKLVSIVLPIHNGARYLRQSIESCLDQTYGDLQLIVVDDASTDDTAVIVRSYNDPRVTPIGLSTNVGLPRALNVGFEHAAGDFLTWTSDDNYYAPDALEHMVHFLETHSEIDFVYTDYTVIDDNDQVQRVMTAPPPEEMLLSNRVGGCFLYRRQVYETLGGFNPEFTLSEDYEYWLRTLCHFRMAPLNRPLYFYRKHEQSLTSERLRDIRRMSWRVRRRWLPHLPGVSRHTLADAYLTFAFQAFAVGEGWEARRWLVQSLLKQPTAVLRPDGMRRSAMVVLGPTLTRKLRSLKFYMRQIRG